jgi:hypothetical protein
VSSTPTIPIADPFDQLLAAAKTTATVMQRDLAGTGDGYGLNSPSFTALATGVPCRVGILGVPPDKEFLAKSKEHIAFRKVLLRPWFADPSPDGSYQPNHAVGATTYNTEPLTGFNWFLIDGEMYNIFELRNPSFLFHHFEALCRVIEVSNHKV